MPYRPRATSDNPYGPQVSFRTEDVLPPTAYYLSPEDYLGVSVLTDLAGVQILMQVRLLLPAGEMKVIPVSFTWSQALTWGVAFQLPPVEGYILGVICWASQPERGRCWVSVHIRRGQQVVPPVTNEVLVEGYVTTLNVLSYPASPLQDTFNGRGAFVTVTGTAAAGANFVLTVPAFTLWRLQSLNFTLSSSSGGGNRTVGIVVKDASNVQVGLWTTADSQSISGTDIYGFSPGGQNTFTSNLITIAGPSELYLPAGASLQSAVLGLQPGDQFSSIAGMVEEWVGG